MNKEVSEGVQTWPKEKEKLSGLKQQKFILSELWRPEVQDQCVSRIGSFLKLYGRILPCLFQVLVALGVP